MRNSIRLPSTSQVKNHFHRVVEDIDPMNKKPMSRSHVLLSEEEPRDESIEAKWEHLRYFEEGKWQQQALPGHSMQADSSYSSLTSSSTSSTHNQTMRNGDSKHSDSNSSSSSSVSNARIKLQMIRKTSWKKIRKQFGFTSNSGRSKPNVEYKDSAISTAPNGEQDSSQGQPKSSMNTISKIRSSKSMQNLDRLTRDSYYNLREVTSDIKERYHSRVELSKAKPKSDYNEFLDEADNSDEDDEDLGNVRGLKPNRFSFSRYW